jgi:hypothetical protein
MGPTRKYVGSSCAHSVTPARDTQHTVHESGTPYHDDVISRSRERGAHVVQGLRDPVCRHDAFRVSSPRGRAHERSHRRAELMLPTRCAVLEVDPFVDRRGEERTRGAFHLIRGRNEPPRPVQLRTCQGFWQQFLCRLSNTKIHYARSHPPPGGNRPESRHPGLLNFSESPHPPSHELYELHQADRSPRAPWAVRRLTRRARF